MNEKRLKLKKRNALIRKLALPVLIIVIFLAVFLATGTNPVAAICKQEAESMGLNWKFSGAAGCMIEQVDGTWTQLNPVINQR